MKYNAKKKALGDLLVLDLIDSPKTDVYVIKNSPFDQEHNIQPKAILEAIQQLPGPKEALELLGKNPSATSTEIGQMLQEAYDTKWTDQTTLLVGKTFRAWAKFAGVISGRRRKKKDRMQAPTLWKDTE